MKKVTILMLAIGGSMFLTSCAKMIDLSDKENEVITQYMADIVVEKTIYSSILPEREVMSLLSTEDTDKNSDHKDSSIEKKESKKEQDTKKETDTNSATLLNNQSKANDSKEKVVENIFQVSKDDKLTIQYKSYKLLDEYSNGVEHSYTVKANNNKKLLVVYFDIKNLSDKAKKLDLVEEGYEYTFKSGTQVIKPLITLLSEDIQYMNTKVKANTTDKAVLVFSVDPKVDLTKGMLVITKDGKSSQINLN